MTIASRCKGILVLAGIAICMPMFAQVAKTSIPDSRLLSEHWTAYWITHPNSSGVEYGVYHFRKDLMMETVPETFVVNISADNRYKFFVNGTEVCFGPARGDLAHWYYETIDIAPFLKTGNNVLAAVVWNFSVHRPWAQFSLRTAFVLQGNTVAEENANTNNTWKVIRNEAYQPITDFTHLQTFIVVGPGERVNAGKYPWGWNQPGFDTRNWLQAKQIVNPKPRGIGTDIDWVMAARDIPLMENKLERLKSVRRVEGLRDDLSGILAGKPKIIPARSKVTILLDNGHLTKGYPVLNLSGGAGSKITITYAEALYALDDNHPDPNRRKSNRNRIEGMEMRGTYDVFIPDGAPNRVFSPLWYRTYRYVELKIETGSRPLTINDIYGIFSAYPFETQARFSAIDPLYEQIWEVGWRTARLCAHETYYDCPFYEQLQYVGDTRIQALVSLYVSGDDRLMRKSLRMFDASRIYEGITHSRYPSYSPQFIPPYSLVWINMIHDYYMHRQDEDFIRGFYTGVMNVIQWYLQYINPETGMLGAVPFWNFVDWADEWPWDNNQRIGGVPAGNRDGNSSILTLQLAYTLNEAASLMEFYDDKLRASEYRKRAEQLNQAVLSHAWSSSHGLIADTPGKTIFSQHANIMGILSGALQGNQAKEVMRKILEDKSLIQSTMYFRFYLFLGMIESGFGNEITQQLDQWKDMLDLGLTTFAEKPEPTRSDCHAWSASPLYFFLSSVAGVVPAQPGFKTVRIEPRPGELKTFQAEIPHPSGTIRVTGDNMGENNPIFRIGLPEGLNGRFYWQGKEYGIIPGYNEIRP